MLKQGLKDPMMMKTCSPALLCLFLYAAPAAAHSEDKNINDVYGRLVEARAAGDVEGMAAAFPAEALLIDARPGPALGGGQELATRLRPFAAQLKADGVKVETQYRVERRSVGSNVAVDAGYMRMQMTRPDGQVGARYARYLVTMQRDASGHWRIIADASMPAEEAAWKSAPKVSGLRYDG
jgi:uncharacterized protein (TIGR02246 family)